MRQLLAVLTHWFPDRQFVFAGDGGYGTHALARFAARRRRHLSLVSLFYPTAACTTRRRRSWARRTGGPARRGRSGRPPRRSWPRPGATALKVSWYGGGRRAVEVVSGTGHWYKAAEGLVQVLWVFVHDLTGTHRDTYLFSTDPTMPGARGDRDLHRPLEDRDGPSRLHLKRQVVRHPRRRLRSASPRCLSWPRGADSV